MNKADQWFSVTVPVVTRTHVALLITEHSESNKNEQQYIEGRTLPIVERALATYDDRLSDAICQGFAESYASYGKLIPDGALDDDVRVIVWSQYLDGLILRINSMDVVTGGVTDPEVLMD